MCMCVCVCACVCVCVYVCVRACVQRRGVFMTVQRDVWVEGNSKTDLYWDSENRRDLHMRYQSSKVVCGMMVHGTK